MVELVGFLFVLAGAAASITAAIGRAPSRPDSDEGEGSPIGDTLEPVGRVDLDTDFFGDPVSAPVPAGSEEDVDWLARTLYGEARGEPDAGIYAVGQVILNRVRSPRFPDTVEGVVRQYKQFSVWNDGGSRLLALDDTNATFRRMQGLARRVIAGTAPNPLNPPNSTHYANETTVAGYYGGEIPDGHWIKTAATRQQLGRHTFYTGVA